MNLLYSQKFYLHYPEACPLLSKGKKENAVKQQAYTFSPTLEIIMLVH